MPPDTQTILPNLKANITIKRQLTPKRFMIAALMMQLKTLLRLRPRGSFPLTRQPSRRRIFPTIRPN